MTTVVEPNPTTATTLASAVGDDVRVVASVDALRREVEATPPSAVSETVVLGPGTDLEIAVDLAASWRVTRPHVGVVLVRRRIDTAVLAESLRAGVREVVDERDLSGLNAAVRRSQDLTAALRVSTEEVPVVDTHRGRVVTVFSAKGGCGKTTLATNLAVLLADRGRRDVCLVDLDLAFGDVAIALQLFPSHTIADAVPLGERIEPSAVQALLTPHSSGLTTLVAPVDPGTAQTVPATLVARLLDILRSRYDYVVIDTPPAFDDQVLAAFDVSDVLVLIATLDVPALKNLKLTLETLDLLNYPRDRWRIVLNRADSKVGLSVAEVESTLHVPITAQVPSSRAVPSSVNRGVPIVTDEPRHPVSQSFRALADHLAAMGSVPVEAVTAATRRERRQGGFLQRRSRT